MGNSGGTAMSRDERWVVLCFSYSSIQFLPLPPILSSMFVPLGKTFFCFLEIGFSKVGLPEKPRAPFSPHSQFFSRPGSPSHKASSCPSPFRSQADTSLPARSIPAPSPVTMTSQHFQRGQALLCSLANSQTLSCWAL